MRTAHLPALTGLRFFAALWVVLYHSTRYNLDVLAEHHPALLELVQPVALQGFRGVDLFFMLSGFVLALNYLDQMGPRLTWSSTARFLWLRLARIWPLYVAVLLLAGALIALRARLWDSAPSGKLEPVAFLEQLFMVQLWHRSDTAGSSWSGPAWSLSAEWLAYLLFPLLVLAVLRLQRRLRVRALFVASLAAMGPLMVAGLLNRGFGVEYAWLLRILCEFVAGMLLCAAISRLRLTARQRRTAGVLAIALLVALVGWYYVAFHAGHQWWSGFAILAFLPLIGFLAVGHGPLTSLLATRALVLGGGLSYGLYLLHSPMLYLFRDATRYSRLHLDPLPRYYAELCWIPVIVLLAWATFRFLEEPARRTLRGMLDHPFSPVAAPLIGPEDGPARVVAGPTTGTLASGHDRPQ